MQIKVIKRKFRNADYPPKYLNNVINQFLTLKNNNSFIIPSDLFGRVIHLFWLKYHVVKKMKMLPNISVRNLGHLPINIR